MVALRVAIIAGLLMCTIIPAAAFDGNSKLWKHLGEVSSTNLNIIRAALPELEKRRPKWTNYNVDITELDTIYLVGIWRPEDEQIVTFGDNDEAHAWHRHPGSMNVELDKRTLKVLSVSFSKD